MSSDFLKKLMAFMEHQDDLAMLRKIESDVDLDLVNGLSQWLRSQSDAAEKPFTSGQVMASICYWVALNVANTTTNSEHVCHFVQIYADYIHNAAHVIQEGEAAAAKTSKNKS